MPAVNRCRQCIQQTQQKSQPRKHQKTVSSHVHIPTQQLHHTHHAISGKWGPHTVTGGCDTRGQYSNGNAMYALSTRPLIQTLSNETTNDEVKQVWYVDNSFVVGSPAGVRKWWEYLKAKGPDLGCYPKPAKTILIIKVNSLKQGWPTCLWLGSTRKFLANSRSISR